MWSRITGRSWWVAFVIVLLVTSVVAAIELDSSHTYAPPVGVVLYLWYGEPGTDGGLGTPGWNSASSPGGGVVVDHPTFGYYASDSNRTFKAQVDEMQSIGVSFAVLSWWGPSTKGEAGAINNASLDFFRYLKNTGSSFKAAIMVDSFPQGSNVSMSQAYSYIQSRFVTPFSSWYLDWRNRPLVLFFNPLQPGDNANFSVRTIGNRPNSVDWTWWDAPSQYFSGQGGSANATNDEGLPVISSDGEVTIVPRIDSYYGRANASGFYLRFDPNLNEGLYQEQWSYVLAHSSSVKLIIIYSWNEYHERTEIEPHFDGTASVAQDYLANLTAQYIARLG